MRRLLLGHRREVLVVRRQRRWKLVGGRKMRRLLLGHRQEVLVERPLLQWSLRTLLRTGVGRQRGRTALSLFCLNEALQTKVNTFVQSEKSAAHEAANAAR